MTSPFSQCSWQRPPWAAISSMAPAMMSSEHMRVFRFLYVMNSLNELTPELECLRDALEDPRLVVRG